MWSLSDSIKIGVTLSQSIIIIIIINNHQEPYIYSFQWLRQPRFTATIRQNRWAQGMNNKEWKMYMALFVPLHSRYVHCPPPISGFMLLFILFNMIVIYILTTWLMKLIVPWLSQFMAPSFFGSVMKELSILQIISPLQVHISLKGFHCQCILNYKLVIENPISYYILAVVITCNTKWKWWTFPHIFV